MYVICARVSRSTVNSSSMDSGPYTFFVPIVTKASHVDTVNGLCLVQKLRNDLSTIFGSAQTAINYRSVGGAQCISSCDCMTSILALMTCAEPSLRFFGSYSGKPNLNASLPQEIVVWVRGVRPGCGSCHRMCASVPPFHFVYIRTAPKTARPYSRSHSRSSE